MLHGYRCFIEENINKLVGMYITIGSYIVKRHLLGRNVFAIMNYGILMALCVLSVFLCHYYSTEKSRNIHFIIQIVIMIIGIISFLFSNNKAFDRGYTFAMNQKKLTNSFEDD